MGELTALPPETPLDLGEERRGKRKERSGEEGRWEERGGKGMEGDIDPQ